MSALEKYPRRDEKLADGKPRNWGLFGYESAIVHMIVTRDDVPAMQEALQLGWIRKDSPVLGQASMHEYCVNAGGVKCAELFA